MNFSDMLGGRCTVCGEVPAWGAPLKRCERCGGAVCAACWQDRPLLSLIATGCRHRRILPGQRPDVFPTDLFPK